MKNFIKLSVLLLVMLLFSGHANAQMTVTVSTNPGGITNCDARVISVSATGGSGNYEYRYTIAPLAGNTGTVQSMDTPTYTISPVPPKSTIYRVTVTDNITLETVTKQITVGPLLIGEPSTWITNILTPNGDGINDRWFVADAGHNVESPAYPINVYRYQLTITNAQNTVMYSEDATAGQNGVVFGTTGFLSRSISWDGNVRINGVYTPAPAGVYFCNLKLFNCSYPSGKDASLYITLIK